MSRLSSNKKDLSGSRKSDSGSQRDETVKVEFELWLRRLSSVPPVLDGRTVYIDWKRGSKQVSGMTKRALVSKDSVSWDEKIVFESTFSKAQGSTNYEGKSLTLKLRDDRHGSKTLIDTLEIPLSNHVLETGSALHTVNFEKTKIDLTYRIKASLLRINEKRVVREAVEGKEPLIPVGGSKLVTYGSKVYVTRTDTHVSDPTNDSESEEETGPDFPVEDVRIRRRSGSGSNTDSKSTRRSSHRTDSAPQAREGRVLAKRESSTSDFFREELEKKEIELQNYIEQNEELESQITHFRLQLKSLRKKVDVAEQELGHSLSGSDDSGNQHSRARSLSSKPLVIQPDQDRQDLVTSNMKVEKLTLENKRLAKSVTELETKLRNLVDHSPTVSPPIEKHPPLSGDGQNPVASSSVSPRDSLRERVKQALEKHQPTDTHALVNDYKTNINHAVFFSNLNPTKSPSSSFSEAYSLLASELRKDSSLISDKLAYTCSTVEKFVIQKVHPLGSETLLLCWLATSLQLSREFKDYSGFLDLSCSIANHILKVFIAERVEPHLSTLFFQPPPQKQPRTALGIASRHLHLADLLGLLSDFIASCGTCGLSPRTVTKLSSALITEVSRSIIRRIFEQPDLCRSDVAINIKLAISGFDEWAQFPSIKVVGLKISSLMALAAEASTLLTLDAAFLRDNIPALSDLFPESTPKILLFLAIAVIEDSSLKRNLQNRLDELRDSPIFRHANTFDAVGRGLI